MDETDTRLIGALQRNARAPLAVLARALGLSRTTVQSRLDRLERSGMIGGYTVSLGDAYTRNQILAYVLITVSHRQSAAVVAAARKMPQVLSLLSVSGAFDLIAKVAAPSVAQMDAVIDTLGALEGVERTTSSVVLSKKIDR